MEKPRIITGDDRWRAYQCDLLEGLLKIAEEIRGLLKKAQEPMKVEVQAISRQQQIRTSAPPSVDKPPAPRVSTQKPKSTGGAQKGGGQSGKNV